MPVPIPDVSLTEGSEGKDVVLPATLAGRKRRLSSSVAPTATSESTTRLVKRPRSNASSTNSCLPSPATTAEESLGDDQTSDPVTKGVAGSRTRKRRLSDADLNMQSKRPRDSVAEPRLHPVSDPLPLSDPESEYSIDEWFKTNFDDLFSLPPPADVAEPDILTQWEVELFNNYTLPGNPQTTNGPPIPIQDNQSLLSTDLTTLDDLFQSIERDAFAAPLEMTHSPVVTSVPGSVPQSLADLLDLSQPIDWTTLLNEDPYELCNSSIFPQPYVDSALPEIDLSMIQLPQV